MQSLSEELLDWYRRNARDLPWRQTDDPYAIWVAEVMLQQTRVETVIPYYRQWLKVFPDVHSLAEADIDRVLQVWEGLGYYRRAHNLQRAARIIVKVHQGRLPVSIEDLKQLPGIGDYTASAIAAIAFGVDTVALDGNLRRVLSRLFDIDAPLGSAVAERAFRERGASLLPSGQASAFNQAMMDLGSTLCTPSSPRCPDCPLKGGCLALQRGTQERRPVRPARGSIPQRRRVAAVIRDGSKVLLGRRPSGGLLSGMWEFPGADLLEGEGAHSALGRVLRDSLTAELDSATLLTEVDHSYTHYRVRASAYQVEAVDPMEPAEGQSELQWVQTNELPEYPMGKVDRIIAERLVESQPGESVAG